MAEEVRANWQDLGQGNRSGSDNFSPGRKIHLDNIHNHATWLMILFRDQ